jgi:DNA-binding response OmpR family regulator
MIKPREMVKGTIVSSPVHSCREGDPKSERENPDACRAEFSDARGDARAESRLHLGTCVLDLQARELRTAGDQPVELRPKALDVLLVLAEQPGRVVDKQTLMDRVWTGSWSVMTR